MARGPKKESLRSVTRVRSSRSAQSKAAGGIALEAGDAASLRERVLDAVEVCFLRHGIRKTTVEDVAREAHLSRMTVYRLFSNRDALFQSVIFRHAERFTVAMTEHLAKFSTGDEQLFEGIVYALRELPKGPLHSIFFGPDAALMTTRFAITSDNLLRMGTYLLAPMLEPARAQGRLRKGVTLAQVQEWLVRVILSFLMVQGSDEWDGEAVRHMTRSFILPSVLKENLSDANLSYAKEAP